MQQRPNDVGVACEYERCVGVLAISHCGLGQLDSALACLNELKETVPRSSIADAQVAKLAAACTAELRVIAETATTSSTDPAAPFIAMCIESHGQAIDQGLDPTWVEKHDAFNVLRDQAEFARILERESR